MKFSPSSPKAAQATCPKCKVVFGTPLTAGSARVPRAWLGGSPSQWTTRSSRTRTHAGRVRSPRIFTAAAFTIAELLVVILIIGILAALALPALKGFGESNALTTATQQLLDDVGYARQKAINDRTKVYMVFLPPEFWAGVNQPATQSLNAESRSNLMELVSGQYTSYALFSERSIGDQPGRSSPRYLTEWRSLPEGMIIETNKFFANETLLDLNDPTRMGKWVVERFATNQFPFPPAELTNTAAGAPAKFWLPCIAFDARGQLVPRPVNQNSDNDYDEFIPLAKGSVMFDRDLNTGKPTLTRPDVIEKGYREATRTNYVLIHIDWLTGRAKVEKQELQ